MQIRAMMCDAEDIDACFQVTAPHNKSYLGNPTLLKRIQMETRRAEYVNDHVLQEYVSMLLRVLPDDIV